MIDVLTTSWGAPIRVLPDGRIITLETDLFNLRLTVSSAESFGIGVYDNDW